MRNNVPDQVTERRHHSIRKRTSAQICLIVASSPDADTIGRTIDLTAGPVTLGRYQDGEHGFSDVFLSRQHARIRRAGDDLVIEDLKSSNGTFVNGARIDQPSAIEPGDVVRIGATLCVVEREAAEASNVREAELPEIVGHSLATRSLKRTIATVAATDDPVLILGESGSGKEVTARAIHRVSGRSGLFVAVNCAAIPTELAEAELFGAKKGAFTGADHDRIGYFEQSNGGTLFLDEIGELAPALQAKLLRALESRTIRPLGASEDVVLDLRIVAATNADLESGSFREDLYARLEDWVIELPPLRERRADVIPLFEHFFGRPLDHDSETMREALLLHDWPLNARELRKIAKRMRAVSGEHPCCSAQLPQELRREDTAPAKKRVPDRSTLLEALRAHGGNISKVADQLGQHRKQVYRWLARHRIDPEGFRAEAI